MNLKVIAFDADDTLFVNEPYFEETEKKFCGLMEDYLSHQSLSQELFRTEIQNLPVYGYGIKGFILSMMEAALELSNYQVTPQTMQSIVDIGKEMLNKPVELLDGVEEVLNQLSKTHRLILATKGDLLDQERKLEKSGLIKYFHHIEVMSDKRSCDYQKLLNHLDIEPQQFLMVGNSLKSDILPLVEIGAHAIHVPFHTTWQHEQVCPSTIKGKNYQTVNGILEILKFIK